MLGVITNQPDAVFQTGVIEGMRTIALQRGFDLKVQVALPVVQDASELLNALHEVKGIIVIANLLSETALDQIARKGIAISLVSHQSPDIPSVVPNNAQGIAILMEHLVIQRGRHKPVFIQGNMAQDDALQRSAAFEDEVMRYNLTQTYRINGNFNPAAAAEAMRDLLKQNPDFDCVIGADYLMALAAMDVLKSEGYRIPEDIAVVGFGDGVEAANAGLTTVAADIVELGRRGARQLLHQLEGHRIRGQTLLSTTLITRDTTRLPEGNEP